MFFVSLVLGILITLTWRKPDVYIGGRTDTYMRRWWVIPRNPILNIYLHQFLRDDDDRALHDHPWPSLSIILRTGYLEHLPGGRLKRRYPGGVHGRLPTQAHRVELLRGPMGKPIPAWTIFITGPRLRDWGFHCPKGWLSHKQFLNMSDGGETIGKGCDQ